MKWENTNFVSMSSTVMDRTRSSLLWFRIFCLTFPARWWISDTKTEASHIIISSLWLIWKMRNKLHFGKISWITSLCVFWLCSASQEMEDSVPKFETQTESTSEVHRHLVHWWSGPENVLELHSTEKRKFHTWDKEQTWENLRLVLHSTHYPLTGEHLSKTTPSSLA